MKIRIIFIVLLFIIISGLIFWHWLNSPVNSQGSDIKLTITKGQSVKQVGDNLYKTGLIKSKLFFRYVIWRAKANLKAGEYALNQKMTTRQIASTIINGDILNREKTIRLIEGWRINDINDYLVKNKIFSDDNFSTLAKSQIGRWKFKFVKPDFLNDAPNSASLEGYLFPDTYRIFNDAGSEDIIAKILANFDRKLTDKIRQDISKQNKSIFQVVTMASLVEKEAKTPNDMKIVAGIFWDRIKNKIPLQSDATLSYILNDNQPSHSLAETKIDSPYNTYKYLDLPPSPICNPGLNAITAAVYPIYTDYNYFLSRSDNGATVFSKTLEEHNLNKAKYLK